MYLEKLNCGKTSIARRLPNLNRCVVSEAERLLKDDANLVYAIIDAALGTKTRSWPLLMSMTGDAVVD
jgi:hypothetical protein